jgi:hypothetical protein
MRKATPTGLASKNSGGLRSLDMQAVASQPGRWETRLTLRVYTQALLTMHAAPGSLVPKAQRLALRARFALRVCAATATVGRTRRCIRWRFVYRRARPPAWAQRFDW